MSIYATEGGTPRELTPAGNHVARCYSVVHCGTTSTEYAGKPRRQNRIRITWELCNIRREFDGVEKPLAIGRWYTLSLHEHANLRADLEAWRGQAFTAEELEAFDVSRLIGVPCLLNVIHATTQTIPAHEYAKITTIAPVPKGLEIPVQFNPSCEYSVSDHNETIFENLPEFLRDEIQRSEEWYARMNPPEQPVAATSGDTMPGGDPLGDDLPF